MTRASRVPQPTLDLSRRSLFGAVLGIGALATLQACGGEAEGGSGGAGGGTVKWAWQMPTTWDPVTSSAGSDVQMLALTYSALTFIDNQGNAQPNLVESWEYAKDGKSVAFTLKEGLVFSDGSPIDAEAVKKSLERGRDADNSLIAAQLADLTDVTADDDLTFTLELAGPNYQYPNLLAGKTGMVVNPAVFESDPDSLATQPAGSGPFVLDSLRAELQGGAAQERQVLRGRRHHDHELRALPGGGRGHRGRVAAVGPVQRRPAARQPARGGQGRRPRGAGDALARTSRRST